MVFTASRYDRQLAERLGENTAQNLMRDDYLQNALKVIDDPMVLVNVVSRRVKQLKRGNRPLVVSLEKMSAEDTALREIAEGKITYELASDAELERASRPPVKTTLHLGTFGSHA